MEKEKKSKGKGKEFLSKNVYYVIMVVCVLIIAAMIAVVALTTKNDNDVTKPASNNTPSGNVEQPVNNQTGDPDPVSGEEPVDTTPKTNVFIMPVEEAQVGLDYSVDALVFYASLNNWQVHKGIDFVTGSPADVKAVMDGTVEDLTTDALNGTVITLKHRDGFKSVYKSLTDANIKVGDIVKQGDVLGKTSVSMATEASQGDHLHFELQKDGKTVDPNLYLPTPEK